MKMSIVSKRTRDQQKCTGFHSLLDRLPSRVRKSKGRRKKNELWGAEQLALVFADCIGLTMCVVIESPHGRLLCFQAQRVRYGQLIGLGQNNGDIRFDKFI